MVANVDVLHQIRLQGLQDGDDLQVKDKDRDINMNINRKVKDIKNLSKDNSSDSTDDREKDIRVENTLVKVLTKRVFEMIFEEVNTPESQMLIKRKIITPVINMIYIELYPYIIAMIVSILTILILSSLTFVGFIFYFIKKR